MLLKGRASLYERSKLINLYDILKEILNVEIFYERFLQFFAKNSSINGKTTEKSFELILSLSDTQNEIKRSKEKFSWKPIYIRKVFFFVRGWKKCILYWVFFVSDFVGSSKTLLIRRWGFPQIKVCGFSSKTLKFHFF